jgi:hypothetical protein
MKTFIIAATLAGVLASPALAQSYSPDLGTGNIAPNYSASPWFDPEYASEYGAFARVHPRVFHHRVTVRHAW